jgi:hypothetical protein
MKSEMRRVARYPLVAAVEIHDLATGVRIAARISDLSVFGCYVDTVNPLPHRTGVRVQIAYNGETFTALGTVAFSSPPMGMGIKFTDVEKDQQAMLQTWLDSFAVTYF